MTKTESITHNGQPALRISCSCTTHPAGANSAVMIGRTSLPKDRIHGFVLLANHPVASMRARNAAKGILPAA